MTDRHLPALSRRSFLTLLARSVVTAAGIPIVAAAAGAAPVAEAAGGGVIYHGDRTRRVVALTIDDGWGPSRVRRIFDILRAENVAATFFPYTQAMHLDAKLWRQIADAGFPIGNHTNSHPPMPQLSTRAMELELRNARRVVHEITGRDILPVFRPPYGAYDERVVRVSEEQGFPIVLMWDTSDGSSSSRGSADEHLRAALRGRNGSVLLTHGGPAVAPEILPSVIATYRQRGFDFVTVPELLNLADPSLRGVVHPSRGRTAPGRSGVRPA